MFLREAPTLTLKGMMGDLDTPHESVSVYGNEIQVDLTGSTDTIRVGERAVPASFDSLMVLADWLDIPASFLKRLDPDLKQHTLNTLAARTPEHLVVRIGDTDVVQSISTPLAKTIDPRQLVEVAIHVMGEDALVERVEREALDFRFDAVVPDNASFGIGGDAKVGDLTKGGLRWSHTNKGGLAPSVQRFLYRLVCTNGAEMFDPGLKVDARGGTVETMLAELEAVAERAFSSLERDIAHFYDLRNRPVDNPERTLSRMAVESKLSERLRFRIIDRVPTIAAAKGHDGASISEFDLANLVTNTANDPTITQWGAIRKLQLFGGAIVRTQVERCGSCASKLSA